MSIFRVPTSHYPTPRPWLPTFRDPVLPQNALIRHLLLDPVVRTISLNFQTTTAVSFTTLPLIAVLPSPPSATMRAKLISGKNGDLARHADFLKEVAAREADAQVNKRPPPLSIEEHARLRERLERVRFIKPKFALETKINVSGLFAKWKRFVLTVLPNTVWSCAI